MIPKMRRLLGRTAAAALAAAGTAACVSLFSSAYEKGEKSASSRFAAQSAAVSAASVPEVPPRAPSSAPEASAASRPESAAPAALKSHDLVLVNGENSMPSWFSPELTEAYGLQMDSAAAKAFAEMQTDASGDGVTLWISSAYRSGELQSELFRREIEEYSKTCATYAEAEAYAAQSVAPPGFSEHETGLALDLNGVRGDFDTTPAFRWLSRRAQDYGFILRYPKEKQSVTKIKYEPWHYRYVGVGPAREMKQSGQCLEEYLAQKGGSVH